MRLMMKKLSKSLDILYEKNEQYEFDFCLLMKKNLKAFMAKLWTISKCFWMKQFWSQQRPTITIRSINEVLIKKQNFENEPEEILK